MTTETEFSEEFLSAFVDHQLDPDEMVRAYALLAHNDEFNRRVCELRKIRDLVQMAFKDVGQHHHPSTNGSNQYGAGPIRYAVALVLLMIGIALGWSLRNFPVPAAVIGTRAIGSPTPLKQSAAVPIEAKVLFHLNSGRRRRMREVLDEAQNLLQLYRAQGRPAEVEIIANGAGIDLLRQHHSPFAARIRAMHKQYANLTFAACQNTISRLIREQGIHPHLLPEATVVDSGVAQIIRLQQSGWTYIRV